MEPEFDTLPSEIWVGYIIPSLFHSERIVKLMKPFGKDMTASMRRFRFENVRTLRRVCKTLMAYVHLFITFKTPSTEEFLDWFMSRSKLTMSDLPFPIYFDMTHIYSSGLMSSDMTCFESMLLWTGAVTSIGDNNSNKTPLLMNHHRMNCLLENMHVLLSIPVIRFAWFPYMKPENEYIVSRVLGPRWLEKSHIGTYPQSVYNGLIAYSKHRVYLSTSLKTDLFKNLQDEDRERDTLRKSMMKRLSYVEEISLTCEDSPGGYTLVENVIIEEISRHMPNVRRIRIPFFPLPESIKFFDETLEEIVISRDIFQLHTNIRFYRTHLFLLAKNPNLRVLVLSGSGVLKEWNLVNTIENELKTRRNLMSIREHQDGNDRWSEYMTHIDEEETLHWGNILKEKILSLKRKSKHQDVETTRSNFINKYCLLASRVIFYMNRWSSTMVLTRATLDFIKFLISHGADISSDIVAQNNDRIRKREIRKRTTMAFISNMNGKKVHEGSDDEVKLEDFFDTVTKWHIRFPCDDIMIEQQIKNGAVKDVKTSCTFVDIIMAMFLNDAIICREGTNKLVLFNELLSIPVYVRKDLLSSLSVPIALLDTIDERSANMSFTSLCFVSISSVANIVYEAITSRAWLVAELLLTKPIYKDFHRSIRYITDPSDFQYHTGDSFQTAIQNSISKEDLKELQIKDNRTFESIFRVSQILCPHAHI